MILSVPFALAAAFSVNAAAADGPTRDAAHVTRCDAVRGYGDAGIRGCYWRLANRPSVIASRSTAAFLRR
jgi:hypothetical protein